MRQPPFKTTEMKQLSVILSTFLFVFANCKKDELETKDENGTVIKKNYIWKSPLTENQWIWSGPIQVPVYKEKFITATHFEANAKLAALNIFTGETEWEWNDYIGRDQNEIFLSLHWPYYHENILIFQKGPRSYCIDMGTGQTVWKIEAEQGYHTHLTGKGTEYLSIGQNGDTLGRPFKVDFIGDIYTGDKYPTPHPEIELLPISSSGNAMASNGGTLFEANGKQYLLSSYSKSAENWEVLPFLGLYNRTEDRWEYAEKQILPRHRRNSITNFPIVHDGLVVTSVGYHICVNDLWTGDSIWAYDCGGNFLFGGFFIHEGRIYAMAEPVALYCLDLYTGAVIWKQDNDGLGTTSKMSHLNGVVYFSSGGNGRLMAVDMEDGKLLWNIESPDGEGYKEVAVYPGKDGEQPLVLTATYQNAYCFEAIR